MLRRVLTENMSNDEVLETVKRKRILMHVIRKRQLNILGNTIKKDGFENLMLIGQ